MNVFAHTRYRLTTRFSVLLLAIILLAGCNTGNGGALSGSGFVEADDVIVSAEVGGRIERLHFDDGDRIRRGDTIAIIDTTSIDLEIAALSASMTVAQTRIEAARTQLDRARETERFATQERARQEKLAASGTTTIRQLDQLRYEEKQAHLGTSAAVTSLTTAEQELTRMQADMNRLKRRRQDSFPLSPLNGVVLERLVEAGELATPGKGLVKLASLDTVKVKIYLGTSALTSLKVGQTISVSTESGKTSHTGVITRIADQAEFAPKNVQTAESRADLVYAVTIRVPNPDQTLKIGMPVFAAADGK